MLNDRFPLLLLGFVLVPGAIALAGCSGAAQIVLRDGTTVRGPIVDSDNATIHVEVTDYRPGVPAMPASTSPAPTIDPGDTVVVQRTAILEVRHPGVGLTIAGAAVGGTGLLLTATALLPLLFNPSSLSYVSVPYLLAGVPTTIVGIALLVVGLSQQDESRARAGSSRASAELSWVPMPIVQASREGTVVGLGWSGAL